MFSSSNEEVAPSGLAGAGSGTRRRRGALLLVVVAVGLGTAGLGLRSWLRSAHQAANRAEALRLSRSGGFDDAEPLLLSCLEANADDPEVVQALAVGYLEGGNLRAALAFCNRWCNLQPDRPEPHQARMQCAMRTRMYALAAADGERVLAAEPGNVKVQQGIALMLNLDGQPVQAERSCRRSLQDRPDDPGLRYMLANACYLQGKNPEAERLLELLLRDQPHFPEAMMLRVLLFQEAGEDNKAIPLLHQILEQQPFNRAAHYYLSLALARTGRAAEAEQELAVMRRHSDAQALLQASTTQPENLDLKLRAAEALMRSGRSDDGIRLLEEILARDPGHAEAHRLLAASQGGAHALGGP